MIHGFPVSAGEGDGLATGQTYAPDLRDRVLAAEGTSRQVAERFGVSASYVIKARQRLARVECDTPRPQKPPVVRLLVALHDPIAAEVVRAPDITIAELRDWLLRDHQVSASSGTVWNMLNRLGLTRKKVPSRERAGAPRHRKSAPHLVPASARPET